VKTRAHGHEQLRRVSEKQEPGGATLDTRRSVAKQPDSTSAGSAAAADCRFVLPRIFGWNRRRVGSRDVDFSRRQDASTQRERQRRIGLLDARVFRGSDRQAPFFSLSKCTKSTQRRKDRYSSGDTFDIDYSLMNPSRKTLAIAWSDTTRGKLPKRVRCSASTRRIVTR
jgi:hypothetical protein